MLFGRKKEKQNLIPPEGMGRGDVRTESSICTGETLIGFYDAASGQLLRAVVVRTPADFAGFYHAYGWEPPHKML